MKPRPFINDDHVPPLTDYAVAPPQVALVYLGQIRQRLGLERHLVPPDAPDGTGDCRRCLSTTVDIWHHGRTPLCRDCWTERMRFLDRLEAA